VDTGRQPPRSTSTKEPISKRIERFVSPVLNTPPPPPSKKRVDVSPRHDDLKVEQPDFETVIDSSHPSTNLAEKVAEEVELNTIVTFCGFIVAFAALSYSGLTEGYKKNIVLCVALSAILYTLFIISIHFYNHEQKNKMSIWFFVVYSLVALGMTTGVTWT
jgi:hypothetical protein